MMIESSTLTLLVALALALLNHHLIALAIRKGSDLLHHLIDALKRRN